MAVDEINKNQKNKPYQILKSHFKGELSDRKIALWGLSFKPNTNDMRDAPSLNFLDSMLAQGAHVVAHDPEAGNEALVRYKQHENFSVCEDPYQALVDAEALVLLTEWRQYWAPDFDRMRNTMSSAVIVDGRNIWSSERTRQRGFIYYSIGRP